MTHPRVKAFVDAGKGVLWGLRSQPHLRFHFFAATVVLLVCHLLAVQKIRLPAFVPVAVVVLFVLVMSLELVNSAVEAACDAITRDHNPLIGAAKDAAAGAVLVAAVGAAAVGLALLGPAAFRLLCEKQPLWQAATLPAVAATLLLYGLHHVFNRAKTGLVLALLCLWAGLVVGVNSPPWILTGLCLTLPLGLYGARFREVSR